MAPRQVALVGVVCVTIGWLLASMLAPPVARVQTMPESSPRVQPALDAPAFTEQLQLRLNALRPMPEARRNPFVFAARERALAEPAAAPVDVEHEPVTAAPSASAPPYVLSGIGITGDQRTAILASGSDVRIVKPDDIVGGFTVGEISDQHVTLVRGSERYVLRLAQ